MAKKVYSEQEKAEAIKKAQELGIQKAAKELGIPWQALARWNKAAGNPTVRSKIAEKKSVSKKTAAKKTSAKKSPKADPKKEAKTSRPSADAKLNAKLKAENKALKAELIKLRKAISKLL